jgi:hypothetical protein
MVVLRSHIHPTDSQPKFVGMIIVPSGGKREGSLLVQLSLTFYAVHSQFGMGGREIGSVLSSSHKEIILIVSIK